MLFKVLAGLRLPHLAGLRPRFLQSGFFLVLLGLGVFTWGSYTVFWQGSTGSLALWAAYLSKPNARNSPDQSVTPIPENFLVPLASASIGNAPLVVVKPTPIIGQPVGIPPMPVYQPDWIRIPIIRVDAPVIAVDSQLVDQEGIQFEQWQAPDMLAAGWHSTSATLGVQGNTVLNGHNNIFGEIFRNLANIKVGDRILVSSGSMVFVYKVSNKMTVKERGQPLEIRIQNASWLLPSDDERLTLITCWPTQSNAYRLIIVARPVSHYEDTQLQK